MPNYQWSKRVMQHEETNHVKFLSQMSKFVGVKYKGMHSRIDTTEMEDLSELSRAIKQEYEDAIPGGSAYIQLFDLQNQLIEDLDDIGEEYYKRTKDGGHFLDIQTTSKFKIKK
jgi:transcription antitermination factor NusG